MTDMTFMREENTYIYKNEQGETLAYLTYEDVAQNTVEATHTVVSERLRGQGIGKKLVTYFLDEMKQQDKKVVPTCWYVKKVIEENETYHGLVSKSM